MEKSEIEFYNGLIKGIVKCYTILQESETIDEARERMAELAQKARDKSISMVDEALP